MPNNRFNKQVTPKGYKAGGMTRKMGKKKNVLSEEGKRKIKSRMTGGDSTGILFPDVYKVKKMCEGRIKKMFGGMMKRPMMKKGGSFMSASSTDKRKISGRGGGADSGKAGEARSKAGVQEVRIKKGIKKGIKRIKDIVTLKPFHKAAEKAYKKSLAEGKTNRGTAEDTKNMRVRRKMGGSLKPVNPQTQKGLSKLPTEVRNKMGYMKKGGKVHGK